MELTDESLTQRQRVLTPLRCTRDDLIIHVSEVAHVVHIVLQLPQKAVQNVESHVDTCMACGKGEASQVETA